MTRRISQPVRTCLHGRHGPVEGLWWERGGPCPVLKKGWARKDHGATSRGIGVMRTMDMSMSKRRRISRRLHGRATKTPAEDVADTPLV